MIPAVAVLSEPIAMERVPEASDDWPIAMPAVPDASDTEPSDSE